MKNIIIAAISLLSYSAFGQYGLGNPGRTMQILGYQTSARGIVHYASGLPNTVIRWRDTKDTAAYLWCDTLTSRLYNWNHTANKWETMGVMEAASAPPATQTNGLATIDNRNAFWRSTSNNDFHYYDRDLTAWTAFGSGGGGADNWGTQVVETNVTLSGDGTAGTELGIAQQGATSGQVLKWNGTTWAPAADNTGGGGGTWGSITGTLSDQTDLQSALNAKANSSHTHAPGDITQSGATSGQVLKWNGSAWAPANDTDTDAQTLSFTEPNLSITGGNSVDLSGLTPTAEEHQDAAGAMVSGNTETLIAVTYDDPGGKLNFAVTPTLSSYTNDAGFLTGNQSISLSGDVTGSGTTAITTAIAAGAVGPTQLASTAVTPGSYTAANITVDADGRVTAASNGTGGATGHTIKDDGASMTQRSGLNFTSNSSINAALTDDAAGDETEVALNIITGAVGPTEIASTAVTPGSYTLSSVTVDADGRITAASNGGEVDGSVTNEGSLSVGAGTGSTSLIQSNTSGSATVTITGAGIASVSETGNTITITATEVDGSTTNEIQDLSLSSNTLSLTGDGTTVDLSGYLDNTDAQGMTITGVSAPFTLDISGGTDVNFNAGTGISLSESPANTLVITNSAPDQTVSIANGGGVAVSGTYPAFTLTATDQAVTNEGSLTVTAGTGTTSVISSNTSGSTNVTLTASTGLSIGETGNVITLTNTGDTDAANDLTTASTAGGDLSGTFSALDLGTGVVGPTELASTAVTPGSYTAANITVDADGRVTAASNGTGGATGHTIRDNGTNETQRGALNFISTSTITAAVADDAGGDESEVTMSIPAGGVTTTEILNSTVAYADIQNISATDKVLGRSTAGAGVIEEITMTAAGRALIDDASAADQRTTLGLGTIATQSAASVSITGGSIAGITDVSVTDGGTGASDAATARTNLGAAAAGTNTDINSVELTNTGLTIDDTDASHQLSIIPGSNLTADRTLTITTGDAARTLTFSGDATIAGTHSGTSSGTNTGDQTITLTGDVTGSGTGSFSATIATGAVGPTQLASTAVTPGSYTLSSITVDADGRITAASNGSGGGTNYQTFRDDGSAATVQPNANFVSNADIAFTLTNDGANSETEITADIPAAGVDYAEIQNVSATDRLLGRATAGAGTIEEITCTAAGRALIDDADASAQRTTLGLGTIATQSAASVSISGGSITGITDLAVADGGTGASTAASARSNLSAAQSGTNTDITSVVLNNTGLVIKDSDASHNLTITTGSNITAARSLTINPGDVSRTLTLSGDATLSGGTHSGTNTGDQTITLTGDVTGSGTGSFAASISANAVGNADFRQSAGLSVVGRSANTTGDVADISGTDGQVLRVSGTTLGFGTVATAGIADGGVTMAKISQSSAATGQVMAWNGTAWAPQSISASLVALNAQTGTTYTLVLSDAGKTITMSNASANTLTVPPNSSVAFPTGTVINIVSIAAGQTTLAPGSGVTLSSADAKLKLRVQYSSCSIIKTGTDTWIVVGDLST